jgi:hypothetical protein
MRTFRFVFALIFLAPLAMSCRSGAIAIEQVAVSPWDDGQTVATTMQLKNVGNTTIRNVRVKEIEVDDGRHTGPVALPVVLGDLAPGADIPLDALLQLTGIDGRAHSLRVEGDFRRGSRWRHFHAQQTIRPDSRPRGPIQTVNGTTVKVNPNTAVYPTPPPLRPGLRTPKRRC